MKNSTLFIIAFFSLFALRAQITLTYDNLPAAGDTFILYVDTTTVVDVGTTGGPNVWDFSALSIDSITAKAFGETANLPFANEFPTSNVYEGDSLTAYIMYNRDVPGFNAVGYRGDFGSGPVCVSFTDPELIIGTPCTQGTVNNDHAEFELYFTSFDTMGFTFDVYYVVSAEKTISCDAWGSVTLPGQSFPDVIRIKSVKQSTELIESRMVQFPYTVFTDTVKSETTVQYMFISDEIRYPVAVLDFNATEDTLKKTEFIYSPVNIVSVNNGNWSDPATWDCNCMPLPADHIIINHDVVLDLDYFVGNYLLINQDASLVGNISPRSFAVVEGAFENHGILEVDYLFTEVATISNYDSIRVHTSFYVGADLNNFGVVSEADSLYNSGSLYNEGEIHALNFTNAEILYNEGEMEFMDFTNAGDMTNAGDIYFNDFTNMGTFVNDLTLTGTNDFLNLGIFFLNQNSTMTVSHDFANAEMFFAEGTVDIANNWLNEDTISGNFGQFNVANSTGNTGALLGYFDVCDQTPPPGYPWIDLNTGHIDPTITFCGLVDVEESVPSGNAASLFPNPFSDRAIITTECLPGSVYLLTVYDL
ncbi:MAG: hypothetical protein KJ607_10960, partial [Bacteroidetes bacterium]|nr:hypothetical protein [Bacteroidota bacterium]